MLRVIGLLMGTLVIAIGVRAEDAITLKGEVTNAVNWGPPQGWEIDLQDSADPNESYRITKVPSLDSLQNQGVDIRKIGTISVKVKPRDTQNGYQFISWGPSVEKKIAKRSEDQRRVRTEAPKRKQRAIAAYIKKYGRVGPPESFLRSEIETQDSNYNAVKFAVIELHDFYSQADGGPKWTKLSEGKWQLDVNVAGKEMRWTFEKRGTAVIPVAMSYSGRSADFGTMHRFLEQVANTVPELRKRQ